MARVLSIMVTKPMTDNMVCVRVCVCIYIYVYVCSLLPAVWRGYMA